MNWTDKMKREIVGLRHARDKWKERALNYKHVNEELKAEIGRLKREKERCEHEPICT